MDTAISGIRSMCFTRAKTALKAITKDEFILFNELYAKYTKEKKWKRRKRTDKLIRIRENHVFFKKNNRILGGFTPLEKENDWVELTTLWAKVEGNGVGSKLLKTIKKEYSKIFLFCKKEQVGAHKFFDKNGFKDLGNEPKKWNVDKFIKRTPHSKGARLFIWQNN